MVCSICNQAGHNALNCNGELITEWNEKVTRFWIHGHDNSEENDAIVKEWARTTRFKMPFINRLWEHLRGVHFRKQWYRLSQEDINRFAQTRFYDKRPKTVAEFKERIANYVRPVEQEEIGEVLADMDRQAQERRDRIRRDREERRRLHQERQDRLLAERVAQRQREAEDPDLQARRAVEREFDQLYRQVRHAQARADNALRAKKKSISIQTLMDPLDTGYFMNDDCPICMEPQTPANTIALNCRHTCCANCLKQTLKPTKKNQCFTCRVEITQIRFKPDIAPEHFNTISSHVHSLT